MSAHRRLTAVAAVAACMTALVPALVAGPAAVAAPATTEIKPGSLPRGDDVAIPHLEGKTVVDGDVRVRVRAATVRLLGKSGTSYVVNTHNRDFTLSRLLKVDADGSRTVLAKGAEDRLAEPLLSSDGLRVLAVRYPGQGTTVRAWSVATGQLEAKRTFRGYPSILDARGDRVLLVHWSRGTLSWDTGSDDVLRLTKRMGGAASLEDDLLASYTTDPYEGGCTVVSRISDPGDDLWKSCGERVESFAPGGRRMVTVHILSDGIGPNQAQVRAVRGRLVARYQVDGWFGALTFETPKALLLETHGKKKATTARCVKAACERAEDLERTQPLRAG
jgi:hypothetical protein